jgi:large subunit ribosomal protein L23
MSEGKYTFKVAKKATKIDVRNAVEKLFGVKVLDVTTMNVKGKPKRQGATSGKTSDWKKAIVTIDTNPSDKVYLEKGGKEKTVSAKAYKTAIEEFGA